MALDSGAAGVAEAVVIAGLTKKNLQNLACPKLLDTV
jgi:hypothetical protein